MIKIILFGINYGIGLFDIELFGITLRYRTVRFLYAHPEAVTFGKLSAF